MPELEISEDFLRDSIRGLSPKRELFAGKQFLEMLLNEKGINYTMEFINKMLDVLDDEEELNHRLDFDDDQKRIFYNANFNYMTRRHFLQTLAWITSGAVFLAGGTVGQIINISEYIGLKEKPPIQNSDQPGLEHIQEFIHKHLLPAAEIICGAALINEGCEKIIELKLDQVARAITQFADRIKEKYPSAIIQP